MIYRLTSQLTRSQCLLQLIAFSALLICISSLPAWVIDEKSKKAGLVECASSLIKEHNQGWRGKPDKVLCFEAYLSNFDIGSHRA